MNPSQRITVILFLVKFAVPLAPGNPQLFIGSDLCGL
jgi:hypothetical protein